MFPQLVIYLQLYSLLFFCILIIGLTRDKNVRTVQISSIKTLKLTFLKLSIPLNLKLQ